MLQEDTIIIALYLGICEILGEEDYKHTQGKLYLSEIILCGLLFALKGGSFRRFYNWMRRRKLMNLPERSRLQRLLITHQSKCNQFLSHPTILNVMDSFGVEVIHPIREGRSNQSQMVSRKGKSNRRWIVGRKLNVAINSELEVVNVHDETANVCDNRFNKHYQKVNGIILTDQGYRQKGGVPKNFKICNQGRWNDRMCIERLFSLWTRICGMKHSFHRSVRGFKAKVSYLAALTNLVFKLNGEFGFNKFSMVQWAI